MSAVWYINPSVERVLRQLVGNGPSGRCEMQMETVVVMLKEKKDDKGEVIREAKVLVGLGTGRVEQASTRESVLHREDVYAVTKDIPVEELEVLVASVPFRAVGCS